MSRKNEKVNRIVQSSSLYSRLNAYDRKILVQLITRAFEWGFRDHEEQPDVKR